MSESINDENKDKSESNIDLVYSYTEKLIEDQNDSLNRLDTRLSGLLVFTGVMIKFAYEFPAKEDLQCKITLTCYSCIILQIGTILCLTVAAICLGLGILKGVGAGFIGPKFLKENKDKYAKENLQSLIIDCWIKVQSDYEKLGLKKQAILSRSLGLILVALAMLTVSGKSAGLFPLRPLRTGQATLTASGSTNSF